jgi:hypothetical protein
MEVQAQQLKMVPVEADLFEAVGFTDTNHKLYIKFRDSQALCFEQVPRFRFQGLLAAPRKDAYYRSFIKDKFLTKPVTLPPQF